MSFGDNDKAIFGAGSDLQIYHDGSGSYVDDQGTGGLIMRGTNLFLRSSTNENYIGCIADGTVTLYYDQNPKLATTATGVDVTGTVTATEFNIGEFATSTNVLQSNTGGTGARLRASVSSAAFPTFSFSDDDNTGVFHPTADALAFSTAGAEAMRITADGSVGIGTSSPSVDLHLASGFPAIKLDNTDAGGDAWRIASGDTGSGFAGKLQIYNEDTAVVAMVLDASGNVGIGTAAPTQKLDVSGNARLVGSDPYLQALRTSDFYYGQLSAEGFSAFTNANAPAPITFKTATTERMRITADGNVGIGTAAPDTKLQIGGGGSLGAVTNKQVLTNVFGGYSTANGLQYTLSAFTGTTYEGDPFAATAGETTKNFYHGILTDNSYFNNSRYSIVQGGSERLTVKKDGNVGIGTTAPDFPLDVAGAMKTKAAGVLVSENYSATNDVGKFYDNAGALTIESQIFGNANAASAPIVFRTSSVADGRADRMRITADGSVGIGTAAPKTDLNVIGGSAFGSSNSAMVEITSAGIPYYSIAADASYYRSTRMNVISNGGFADLSFEAVGTALRTGLPSAGTPDTANPLLYLEHTGNVGIGTAAPSAELTVGDGTGAERIRIDKGTASTASLDFYSGGVASGALEYSSFENMTLKGAGYTSFETNSIERLRISASGNVGIGTSSPDTLLHIEGSSPVLRIKATADTEDSLIHFADTSSNFAGVIAYSHNGNDMKFYTSQNERMRVDASGHAIIPAGVTLGTATGVYAAANTLDDYEEGTWTPSLGGTTTYNAQGGAYTKVGNLVTCTFDLHVALIGTGSTTTISGLPFTVGAAPRGTGCVGFFSQLATSIVFTSLRADSASTSIKNSSLTAASAGTSEVAIYGNSARVMGTITYHV